MIWLCDRCLNHKLVTREAISHFHCHGGAILGLCQDHLDYYLDLADDDPRWEPVKVVWRDGSHRALVGAA